MIFGENLDFGDFVKFVKFEILNPSENQNLKSLTLAHQIWIWERKFSIFSWFLYKIEENSDEITKFEVLNPKIQNLAKSQNLRSLTLKSKIFDFDKIWPKIKIPPRWFIITLLFHQNSKFKIFQNLSQYGVTTVTNFFQNFEVDTKIPKSPKLALITKILKKILKTGRTRSPSPRRRNPRGAFTCLTVP